jgi:membrane fusion protein (multidrug efflux system)
MTVRAPFAGVAGKRLAEPGDFVETGQPLLDLVDLDEIEIAFSLPEVHVPRLRLGQEARLRVTSLPAEDFRGEVFFVAPRVDPQNRSIELKARVDNREHRLRPGQFAHVRLTLERRDDVAMVPEEAIVSREGRFFVFVVDGGAAREREVTLGERQDGRVGVLGGLTGGETVVRSGHQRLSDGAAVEVVSAAAVTS